jgi:hypothetical protein
VAAVVAVLLGECWANEWRAGGGGVFVCGGGEGGAGAESIAMERLNDNYCDCDDGR